MYFYPHSFLRLTGGTISGDVLVDQNLSANTIFSASTNLYDIFQTTANVLPPTFVQGGLNLYTGGTQFLPTVNISAATLDNLLNKIISLD